MVLTMARVLVTGGSGFIGSHLVETLLERGEDVVVLDNLKRASVRGSTGNLPAERLTFVHGDIRNFDTVAGAVAGCQTVYHLAAQSNVMGAVSDPEYSFTTNVAGTFNVFRAAAAGKARRVVFTSSREAYGEADVLPIGEDRPLLPKSAYGASKMAGEAYARAFAASSGMAIEIVRLSNVYGPGDSGRVIPLWLDAAQEGRDLEVYGGEQLLDFLWVGTAVQALIAAGERGFRGPTNIGSGKGTQILDLARRIVEVTKSPSRIRRSPARSEEVVRFVADTRRMREEGIVPDDDPLAHLAEMAQMADLTR